MTAPEFYTNILMGVAGNTAYDGLKLHLQSWKDIVLPKSNTENDVIENINMLLQACVQNIETQIQMMQQLADIAQSVRYNPQVFMGNQMVNNLGNVEKQVNNPTIQGDLNM